MRIFLMPILLEHQLSNRIYLMLGFALFYVWFCFVWKALIGCSPIHSRLIQYTFLQEKQTHFLYNLAINLLRAAI